MACRPMGDDEATGGPQLHRTSLRLSCESWLGRVAVGSGCFGVEPDFGVRGMAAWRCGAGLPGPGGGRSGHVREAGYAAAPASSARLAELVEPAAVYAACPIATECADLAKLSGYTGIAAGHGYRNGRLDHARRRHPKLRSARDWSVGASQDRPRSRLSSLTHGFGRGEGDRTAAAAAWSLAGGMGRRRPPRSERPQRCVMTLGIAVGFRDSLGRSQTHRTGRFGST